MNARPFVKMAGGKTSSLPFLEQFVPARIKRYVEPMVGGGALFFHLANQERFSHAVISDSNEDLINAYKVVRDHPRSLIRELKRMKNQQKFFLRQRSLDPLDMPVVDRAARFIFLNKTCFNGLWRVNQQGEFNVPFGHYKNPAICDEQNILECSRALRTVTISCDTYFNLSASNAAGDLMYLDPPYVPVNATSNFVGYTTSGFDHQLLAEWVKGGRWRGALLLSNSDTTTTRRLYRGLKLHETEVRRNINRDGEKRGAVGEILVAINAKRSVGKRVA